MRNYALVMLLLCGCMISVCIGAEAPGTLWCPANAMMPAWGLYPNGASYGDTTVLDGLAAWGTGRLTWVADFPSSGHYQVWARQYGGYGSVSVTIDDVPVTGGRGGAGGVRYVWRHLGEHVITKGRHHVDSYVRGTMFDALLFTLDHDFHPDTGVLPDPVTEPLLQASRAYRNDASLRDLAGHKGYVVAAIDAYEDHLNDVLPEPEHRLEKLQVWGSPQQYISGTFVIRALQDLESLELRMETVTGPGSTVLTAASIDLRIVQLRERIRTLFEGATRQGMCPDLLLRDDRTAIPPKGMQGGFGGGACITRIPAHESRQFWLTIQFPETAPPGRYLGGITLTVANDPDQAYTLPVAIEVLPIDLRPVEGWYGIYYPMQTTNPDEASYVTPERYRMEIEDQVRHGCNGITLYGGVSTLEQAKSAGMTQAPVLMHWPGSAAEQEVARAKALGFPDLYYYGVDEPHGDAIERCRQEAARRNEAGLHMFTAINSKTAYEATKAFIDRPVYNIYTFDGTSGAAEYAREQGFVPISYWVTSISYPLYYRALSGLYNTASGYAGTAPWAYADTPGNGIWVEDRNMHAVSYPDEAGRPIPTLRWEAFREGIDDVRYLQALDRAIHHAQAILEKPDPDAALTDALSQALEVRHTHVERIEKRWFRYLQQVQADSLAATRRAMADATVHLESVAGE